jgi:N-acetylmuramoyl-L-alanine amidase
MGFISNAQEEKWLASEEGQNGIVNSIFTAFGQYYNNIK